MSDSRSPAPPLASAASVASEIVPDAAAGASVNQIVLSRAVLETGEIEAMIARDAPGQRVLSEAERDASLDQALAVRPAGDAWVFAYGSLIWNPTVHSVERRTARIDGWHRAFCLRVRAGRGSPDRPGLVLALDRGGVCTGVAYRIDQSILRDELRILWRREMVSGSYVPRWVAIRDEADGQIGHALAFTIDHTAEQYAGRLPPEQVVTMLATAAGALGSAAEYLFRTCEGLHACGIPDAQLDALADAVRATLPGNEATL